MFLAHVVDLHAGKLTVCERTLKCLTRMIGVHVYLNDLIVCYQYNGITNGIQKFTETADFFLRKRFLKKDDKLCTVTKLDICLCLRRNLGNLRSSRCLKLGVIYFLAVISVNSSAEYFQKPLSA